ncbi:hypothetical protein PX699_03020 [Sphingobium sp. H39-3-25]|uniref:hypothetical protein n=1 Tax=Sphingobium arseniciresistens TaxID=3030834 RepID=UPI0023B8B098|nr:hypothetical protein [Sphingobium arseniciresistens]
MTQMRAMRWVRPDAWSPLPTMLSENSHIEIVLINVLRAAAWAEQQHLDRCLLGCGGGERGDHRLIRGMVRVIGKPAWFSQTSGQLE